MVGVLRFLASSVVVAALLVTLGCGDSSKKGDFPAAVVARLKKADLKPGEFKTADADAYGARQCFKGSVDKLAVLVCRFENEEKAKGAEEKLLKFVGRSVTGAVRVSGKTALVATDPDKTDLRGKKLNSVLKAFAKK